MALKDVRFQPLLSPPSEVKIDWITGLERGLFMTWFDRIKDTPEIWKFSRYAYHLRELDLVHGIPEKSLNAMEERIPGDLGAFSVFGLNKMRAYFYATELGAKIDLTNLGFSNDIGFLRSKDGLLLAEALFIADKLGLKPERMPGDREMIVESLRESRKPGVEPIRKARAIYFARKNGVDVKVGDVEVRDFKKGVDEYKRLTAFLYDEFAEYYFLLKNILTATAIGDVENTQDMPPIKKINI